MGALFVGSSDFESVLVEYSSHFSFFGVSSNIHTIIFKLYTCTIVLTFICTIKYNKEK